MKPGKERTLVHQRESLLREERTENVTFEEGARRKRICLRENNFRLSETFLALGEDRPWHLRSAVQARSQGTGATVERVMRERLLIRAKSLIRKKEVPARVGREVKQKSRIRAVHGQGKRWGVLYPSFGGHQERRRLNSTKKVSLRWGHDGTKPVPLNAYGGTC